MVAEQLTENAPHCLLLPTADFYCRGRLRKHLRTSCPAALRPVRYRGHPRRLRTGLWPGEFATGENILYFLRAGLKFLPTFFARWE